MIKNIFRSRRRSKNGPLGDENEPVTPNKSQTKTFLPIHADTEYINRAASSSQVPGLGRKHSSVARRPRISSVVNKILMTRSESKRAPRAQRIAATGLYIPEVWMQDQSDKDSGMQASGSCHNENTDDVFAVPFSCPSCALEASCDDTGNNGFRLEDAWTCSRCRTDLTKARNRHGSSPAALATPSACSLGPDYSHQLCKLSGDLSHREYNRSFSTYCSHNYSYDHCRICNKGKSHSTENVGACNGLQYIKDSSILPSPLHMYDLECHENKLSDDDEDDDDVIPELVEMSPQSRSPTGDIVQRKQQSSPAFQQTVEHEGRNVNESDMYILTDSFLDDSPTSFAQSAVIPSSLHSNSAGCRPLEVMMAEDHDAISRSETSYGISSNLDLSEEAVCSPVVSPQFAEKTYYQPDDKAEVRHAVLDSEEHTWCRKPLLDWSTDDVLQWVISVGLVQFYDTFRGKFLQTCSA